MVSTYAITQLRQRPNVESQGIPYDELHDDPNLGNRRQHLITQAARVLASAKMIQFDESTGSFTISDLGRIAARHYIRHTSIEIFNKEFRPNMKEAHVLGMLSMCTEVRIAVCSNS